MKTYVIIGALLTMLVLAGCSFGKPVTLRN